ncbi:MAG TPA: YpdA family putative bacillithiol disulfide reductase [Terriglobia bacterium]|jgi:thioredoxin reductase (NADPH)|nr:YpdA family putative bacillithiol disulfide reductase [Terriglobia bacterium]
MADSLDVLVVGAGPTGMACGIEVLRAGLKLLIIEKGCLVNSIFHYPPNMTFFTTRELLEIGDLPFTSTNIKPTRSEALEYYRRVADHYHIPIHYQERVQAVKGSKGSFTVETECGDGSTHTYAARNVILATGYYDLPNLMNIPGEDLPKVSHYYLEPHQYYQQKVAVVGGGNSAAIGALDLYRHGSEVTLIVRERELSRHIKYWIRPDLENRIKEGSIQALFETVVTEVAPRWIFVRNAKGESRRLENDFVFALTGYHPDFDFIRSCGVAIDPVTCRPQCSPETLESNVAGLYLAGVIIAGPDTNEIFIENGRFHGKQIVSDIVRRQQRDV